MKKNLPVFVFCCCAILLDAQTVIYNQNFNAVTPPDLPGGWFATSDQIFTNASSPSSGYSGASGGNNMLSRNCNPNNEVRSFQVDGISSLNYADLTVSFGHRRTNGFTPPVTLEWSSDGASWNGIAYNSAGAGTTWAQFTSATLPDDAGNKPSLSFRWSYTTNLSGSVPCDNFAGNYRIDDFKVTAATVLPVQLVNFTCRRKNASVQLDWRTATESSNDFFAVERSTDGHSFVEIGRVQGAGTSASFHDYTFVDDSPSPDLNYYRLRQVDTDGQFAYSQVVFIRTGRVADIHVFPSPAADVLMIRLEEQEEENMAWEIFDLGGRSIKAGDTLSETNGFGIPVAELPQGMYLLRLVAGQKAHVQKFRKK